LAQRNLAEPRGHSHGCALLRDALIVAHFQTRSMGLRGTSACHARMGTARECVRNVRSKMDSGNRGLLKRKRPQHGGCRGRLRFALSRLVECVRNACESRGELGA
jgi:hypothetical protein